MAVLSLNNVFCHTSMDNLVKSNMCSFLPLDRNNKIK